MEGERGPGFLAEPGGQLALHFGPLNLHTPDCQADKSEMFVMLRARLNGFKETESDREIARGGIEGGGRGRKGWKSMNW